MAYVFSIPRLSLIDQVEQFLMEHPRSTVREVMDAMSMNQSTTNVCLGRLRKSGRCRQAAKVEGERRIRWECGSEEVYEESSRGLRQTTVTTWEPCMLRDPLIDLLFGRATAPVEHS